MRTEVDTFGWLQNAIGYFIKQSLYHETKKNTSYSSFLNKNAAVNNHLDMYGKATIIDCHSYPSKPLKSDLDKGPKRPDFIIGTDSFDTNNELIDISVTFFEKAGYTLGIDWPYKGSIVPIEHYHKNKNVSTKF